MVKSIKKYKFIHNTIIKIMRKFYGGCKMNKWICPTCGYIMDKEKLKICPICKTEDKCFIKISKDKEKNFDNRENINLSKEVDKDMIIDLKNIYLNECREIALYFAMSKIANKEGYEKIAKVYEKIAHEETNHAILLTEMLGEKLNFTTRENLTSVISDEYEATQKKLKVAKKAKEYGLDEIYTILNQMCLDEAKHGKVFSSLLNEYFVYK